MRRTVGMMLCILMVTGAIMPALPTLCADGPVHGPAMAIGPIVFDGSVSMTTLGPGAIKGKGTTDDPFTIEDMVIEANEDSAVLIKDTSAHIVIRDCIITAAPRTSSRDMIANDTFSGQTIGIHIQNSHNTTAYNNIVLNNDIGIFIEGSTNSDIHHNTVHSNNQHGIQVYRAGPDNVIHHNTIYDNEWAGIDLNTSSGNHIHNNTIYTNGYGINFYWSSQDTLVHNNTIYNNLKGEIMQRWTCDDNDLFGNTIYDGEYGMLLDGDRNIVHDNVMHTLTYGVYGENLDGTLIHGNTMNNVTYGIFLSRSRNANEVYDNTIIDAQDTGITLHWESDGNSIYDNTVLSSGHTAIFLHWSSDLNHVRGNLIHHNPVGIHLNWSSNYNEIYNNTIRDNDKGIVYTTNANYNTVYNNYFDNVEDTNVTGGLGNTWNTSKTLWYNIIGGLYIAGNYWVAYNGSDADGDGIGETFVPWDEGDGLPLVPIPADTVDPAVTDKTTDTPSTGAPFQFKATATDNRTVIKVEVEYWFDSGPHTTKRMTMVSGIPTNCDFQMDITVPTDATQLSYVLRAFDFNGNSGATSTKILSVVDDDPPVFEEFLGTPTTGDPFTFNYTVTENIGLSVTSLEYWFDTGTKTTVDLTLDGGFYQATVQVPLSAQVLNYMVSFVDTSDNDVHRASTIDVVDDEAPVLNDTTGIPYTDQELDIVCEVQDNIGVAAVQALITVYKSWGPSSWNQDLTDQGFGIYSYGLWVDNDAINISYNISAWDDAGNVGYVEGGHDVVDDVYPNLEVDVDDPSAGDSLYVSMSAWDNVGINSTWFEYWFDDGEHLNQSYQWGFYINVPNDAIKMYFIASTSDVSGHWTVETDERTVRDYDYPSISDTTGEPVAGEPFTITATITDNVGVNRSEIEVWGDDSLIAFSPFTGEYTVNLPPGTYEIEYEISATDFYGNTQTYHGRRYVVDHTDPVIVDYTTGRPKRGEIFKFNVSVEDNVGVSSVYIEYRYSWWNQYLYLRQEGDRWVGELAIPENELEIQYQVFAQDFQGNTAETEEKTLYTKSPNAGKGDDLNPYMGWILAIVLVAIMLGIFLGAYGYISWSNKQEQAYLQAQQQSQYYQQPPPAPPQQPPPQTPPVQPPPPQTIPPPTPVATSEGSPVIKDEEVIPEAEEPPTG